MNKRLKIIFLSSWYPSDQDKTFGIFVKRHAQSVALYADVSVLYVHEGTEDRLNIYHENGLPQVYSLFKRSKIKIPFISFLINQWRKHKAFKKGMKELQIVFGQPHLLQANVIYPVGFWARYFSKKLHVPYVLMEHWTGYHPADGSYKGGLRKWVTSFCVTHAKAVFTVTHNLAKAMKRHGLGASYHIVPNVVDDVFFDTAIAGTQHDTFIHVSSLDDKQKNVSGIIKVIGILVRRGHNIKLNIVGDGNDRLALEALAGELGLLNKHVFFKGSMNAPLLAELMSCSTALVMFSNYENQPCVILEAFAVGLYVITTDVGGIKEMFPGFAGTLIPSGNEKALTEAMLASLNSSRAGSPEKLRDYAHHNFSMKVVGQKIADIYVNLPR